MMDKRCNTFICKSVFRQKVSALIKVVMEGVPLLLPLFFLLTAGFELKLDSDLSEPDSSRFDWLLLMLSIPLLTSRGLCCLLYSAQSDCASRCQGRSCSDSCQTNCGLLNSQCGSWTCGDITTSCTNTTGTLFMVGGNLQEDNTEIWNRMVEAAGGPGVRKSVLESSRD